MKYHSLFLVAFLALQTVPLVAVGQSSPPDMSKFTKIDGGFLQATFQVNSPSNKETRNCCVVVPPDYFTSSHKYPVVFHLNGITGNERSGLSLIKQAMIPGVEKGTVKPMIWIGVDAGQETMCADSKDGKIMIETFMNREIVPWADATFRTYGDAAHRGLEGNSQGGFGSLLYLNKFPDLYTSIVAWCPALHTAEALAIPGVQVDAGHDLGVVVGKKMYNNDVEYARLYNPWHTWNLHTELLRKTPVCIIVGQRDGFGFYKKDSLYARLLDSLNVQTEFHSVPGVGHGATTILQGMTNRFLAYEFHSKNLNRSPTELLYRNNYTQSVPQVRHLPCLPGLSGLRSKSTGVTQAFDIRGSKVPWSNERDRCNPAGLIIVK